MRHGKKMVGGPTVLPAGLLELGYGGVGATAVWLV